MKVIVFVCLLVLSLGFVSSAVGEFGYNDYDGPVLTKDPKTFDNDTAFVNSSAWWNTGDHGPLRNVGDIDHDWLNPLSLLWSMAGHTMDTLLDMNGNSITEVNNINGTGDITMVGSRSDVEVNLQNMNPYGVTTIDLLSSTGSEVSLAKLGPSIPAIDSNGYQFGGNSSGLISRDINDGSNLVIAASGNNSIIFGNSPDGDTQNLTFGAAYDPTISGFSFLGSKWIRPAIFPAGASLLFQSTDVMPAGQFPFIFIAQDAEDDTVVTSWDQNGKNNSFSGVMNSFVPVPKDWIRFVGNITDDEDGIEFLTNRSNYINYCDYLQTNLSLVPEGCKYYADTTGRGVPLIAAGDLEIHRTAVIHEGLTTFNAFDFIGRNGNDVNMLFNGGLENGNLHITDKRLIEANISFFQQVITNFDDATITPFVSESISPEIGRDWDSVLESECHQDRCGNAKGGNEKVMAFSAATTFQGGTVASSNSRLMFWITSVLSGADTFEVELDNNEGDVSTIYSTGATLVDEFVNVSFGAAFENRDNVTTRFILNGQNVIREVWVDIVEVTSEPAESIIINESYDGGKIVLGEGRDSLSCLIEADKRLNDGTLETEWVMNIGSPGCAVNIAGNVTFTDSTVTNQTVLGDQLVTGDLTVDGLIYGNGSQLTGIDLVSLSSDNQIPFMNSAGDDFEYDSDLTYDGNTLKVDGNISGNMYYDYIIAADGSGDFTDPITALATGDVGASFFIKDGTYVLTANLVFKASQTLIGESKFGVIIDQNETSFQINLARSSTISRLSVINGRDTVGQIIASNTPDVTITDIYINSVAGYLSVPNYGAGIALVNGADDSYINNVEVNGFIYNIKVEFSDRVRVSNCYSSNGKYGYRFRQAEGTTFSNSMSVGDVFGVYLRDSSNGLLSNLVFTGVTTNMYFYNVGASDNNVFSNINGDGAGTVSVRAADGNTFNAVNFNTLYDYGTNNKFIGCNMERLVVQTTAVGSNLIGNTLTSFLDTGTDTFTSGNVFNTIADYENVLEQFGDIRIKSDLNKIYMGAGDDYSQYFDGTDQNFELTSGDFNFDSKIKVIGSDAEGTPSLGSQIGLFQNNPTSTSNAIFGVIAGSSGSGIGQSIAGIQFGDKDAINRGILYYYNHDDSLYIGTAGNVFSGIRLDSSGNLKLANDNQKLIQGAGDDYSQYFDGTNQYFELTSGDFKFDSLVNATSLNAQDGFTGSCINVTYSGGIAISCND